MCKKYIVYGSYVISENDGQIHFISGSKLIRLYNLNPSECIIINTLDDTHKLQGLDLARFQSFYPRQDGKY